MLHVFVCDGTLRRRSFRPGCFPPIIQLIDVMTVKDSSRFPVFHNNLLRLRQRAYSPIGIGSTANHLQIVNLLFRPTIIISTLYIYIYIYRCTRLHVVLVSTCSHDPCPSHCTDRQDQASGPSRTSVPQKNPYHKTNM